MNQLSDLQSARVTNIVTSRAIVMCARDSLGPDATSIEVGELAMRLVVRAGDSIGGQAAAGKTSIVEDELAFGLAMIKSMLNKPAP